MFIILIGSVAREEANINSDIDICRINTTIELSREKSWPNGPINYIDYSLDDFDKLYNKGSLFIYHILNEGILIQGDLKKWEFFKKNFTVQANFQDEINELKFLLLSILKLNLYNGIYLSFYSNLFTILKNYAIFSLAQKNIFIFNKQKAFIEFYGPKYLNFLITSYNIYERNIIENKYKFDYKNKKIALNIINYFMEEIC